MNNMNVFGICYEYAWMFCAKNQIVGFLQKISFPHQKLSTKLPTKQCEIVLIYK